MLRRQNLRAFRLDFSIPNPHLVHAVHQLGDQIEIETGAAERRDLALGRNNHARIFKRVVKIVAGHDGRKLWCPLLFSKSTEGICDGESVLCRLRKQAAALLFRLCLFATRLLLLWLWLKQGGIFAVAFFLHFFRRNKAERRRVYTESLTGRRGAIVEEVAEMRVARFPTNLGALHSVRSIAFLRYVL